MGAASILLVAWASRGALFGAPVADDYDFLYWLRFRPFTLLDSMGAPYYWRPIGRQLYYALVAPVLFQAPWLVSVLHGLLLLATGWFLYRIARRWLTPGLAVAAAVVPILAEPTRSLLIWPTSAQYVLAMLFSTIAVHEALAARKITAALAALAAVLSHGAAALVLWALPLLAWFRTRSLREALIWAGLAVGVGAVWIGGHRLGHGTNFFAGGTLDATLPARLARAVQLTVAAELGLEDARPGFSPLLWGGYGIAFALAAVVYALDGQARRRVAKAWPLLAGTAAWFVIGILPLALLFPDWSSWRIGVATLGVGLFAAAFLGLARPWLAAAFVAIQALALVVAPLAPRGIVKNVPDSRSRMGFVRLVRLQRTVEGARDALLAAHPKLEKGADVAYWSRVAMTEVGFEREKAIRVWYGDSTITWRWLWQGPVPKLQPDVALTFEGTGTYPSIILSPGVMENVRLSMDAFTARRFATCDSLLLEIERTQQPASTEIRAWLLLRRSHVAYNVGRFAQAESLNNILGQLTTEGANYCAMRAALALQRNDRNRTRYWLERAFAQDPNNEVGKRVLKALETIEATLPPAG